MAAGTNQTPFSATGKPRSSRSAERVAPRVACRVKGFDMVISIQSAQLATLLATLCATHSACINASTFQVLHRLNGHSDELLDLPLLFCGRPVCGRFSVFITPVREHLRGIRPAVVC